MSFVWLALEQLNLLRKRFECFVGSERARFRQRVLSVGHLGDTVDQAELASQIRARGKVASSESSALHNQRSHASINSLPILLPRGSFPRKESRTVGSPMCLQTSRTARGGRSRKGALLMWDFPLSRTSSLPAFKLPACLRK